MPPPNRTVPPIRFLASLTEETTKGVEDLIATGLKLIEREVLSSHPDAGDRPLIGAGQAARDQARRALHQAPPETKEERLAKALGVEHYDVPSTLEPLAELARRHTREEFAQLLRGEPTEEERTSRAQAERKEEDLRKALTTNDPNTDARDQIAVATAIRADLVKERWDEHRRLIREALNKSAQYHLEDGLERIPIRPLELYDSSTSAGNLQGEEMKYEAGQPVEVCDPSGNWRPATVTSINFESGIITVQRGDGQTRKIPHMNNIRTLEEARPVFEDETLNGNADDILVSRFQVSIPKNSISWKIEKALIPITAEMNSSPLKVNRATWERNLHRQEDERDRTAAELNRAAGKPVRANSTRDCAQLLFVEHGLTPRRINTKSGEPSVDAETLQALQAEGSELAGVLSKAREAITKLSQLEAWEDQAKAGEVQPRWDALGQPHGRYSASNPNLQNRIREIRETVEAPTGYHLQSFDLGQAEYVTWASLSGDELLCKAFLEGRDFHTTMFEELRKAAPNVKFRETDDRQAGKTINNALLYLMKPFTLAQSLGIPTEEADLLIKAYGARAPDALLYRSQILDEFGTTGRVATKFGRIRQLPTPINRNARHEVNKTAWHHHNAGTAAELVKLKQVKLHRALRLQGWKPADARIALNMHDELILLVRDDLKEEVAALAEMKFREPVPGFLPFEVDHRTGQTWLDISK
jgi:DNA polymerase I-like protein with 3'-5' exonuclease and polymerase domains